MTESPSLLLLTNRYKWQFNGKDFNPTGQGDRVVQLPNDGTIVFNYPEDKDEGVYQCLSDNGYGLSVSVKSNLREAKLANFPIEPARVRNYFVTSHYKKT